MKWYRHPASPPLSTTADFLGTGIPGEIFFVANADLWHVFDGVGYTGGASTSMVRITKNPIECSIPENGKQSRKKLTSAKWMINKLLRGSGSGENLTNDPVYDLTDGRST
jgi:hypothetical protein